jgi:WD40 repeat protein
MFRLLSVAAVAVLAAVAPAQKPPPKIKGKPTPDLVSIDPKFHVHDLAFSPDGSRLLMSGANKEIVSWVRAEKEGTYLKLHSDHVYGLAFSPDGTTFATGGNDSLIGIWDAAENEEKGLIKKHTDKVYGVAFLPDGKRLVSVGEDGLAAVWTVATRKPVAQLDYNGKLTALAVAPDGSRVAFANTVGRVYFWDLTSPRQVLHAEPQPKVEGEQAIWRLSYRPDGKAVAGVDEAARLAVWDATTGGVTRLLAGLKPTVARYSPDGKYLAVGFSDGMVRMYDPTGEKKLGELKCSEGHTIREMTFSPDSTVLAISDTYRYTVDVRSVRSLLVLKGPDEVKIATEVPGR